MDLGSLRYFVVAAKRLHFSQAALELGIAQPALSQRIKALEGRLGVRLFDRSNRAVSLTEAGRVFLGEAERLLDDANRAMRITRAADKGTAGELHVGYAGSVIFEPKVCALLQAFRGRYPDASVILHECNVEEQLEGVKSRRLDAALLWGPLGQGYPELREQVFSLASMSVVLPRDHPLADRSEIAIDDIRTEDFIALIDRPGRGISHVIDGIFAAAQLSPRVVLRVSSLMSVFGLAGAGLGIGIVPTLAFDINSPAFVQRPLARVGDCNQILVVTHKSKMSGLTRTFAEAARAIGGLPQDRTFADSHRTAVFG